MVLRKESGFTLVEVMITLVIAMVILGGLLLNFTSQSTMYKYQNKRVDSVQDLEFALRYIANDLQSAVIGVGSTILGVGTDPYTVSMDGAAGPPPTTSTQLSFYVWDESLTADPDNMRALRCYQFTPPESTVRATGLRGQLYYNRDVASCGAVESLSGYGQVLGEKANGLKGMQVTHFRVFLDLVTDRAGYSDIPPPLPTKIARDEDNKVYNMPGFTVLLEVEVDAAPKGSTVDVLGIAIANGKRRLWRYIQVYPNAVVVQ